MTLLFGIRCPGILPTSPSPPIFYTDKWLPSQLLGSSLATCVVLSFVQFFVVPETSSAGPTLSFNPYRRHFVTLVVLPFWNTVLRLPNSHRTMRGNSTRPHRNIPHTPTG